ncbi:MAG TPA: hypothetical protein VHC18_26845 [Amycolatopsis sp.]|nr:hypothetical protein [Amycolatopsis sp.]
MLYILTGVLVVALCVVLVTQLVVLRGIGNLSTTMRGELGRLRADLLTKVAQSQQDYAQALVESASRLFAGGHTDAATVLERRATELESKASDNLRLAHRYQRSLTRVPRLWRLPLRGRTATRHIPR